MSVQYAANAVLNFGTNVVKGAAHCLGQSQSTVETGLLFATATEQLTELTHAGAHAMIGVNERTLARCPIGETSKMVGQAMAQNPEMPLSQILLNPKTHQPQLQRAIAIKTNEYIEPVKMEALRALNRFSRAGGGLHLTNGFLEKAKLFSANTPPQVQSAANTAFQAVFYAGVLFNAWREVQNAPTYYQLAKKITKIAVLGTLAYNAYKYSEPNASLKTKFANAIKAIRGPIVCMNPEAAAGSAILALASGGLAGGIAGALPGSKSALTIQ